MDWTDDLSRICKLGDGLQSREVQTQVCVYPEDYQQVSSVIRYSCENRLSVHPLCFGKNPVGPGVSAQIGLVLSRIGDVLEVSDENLYAYAQAGCSLEVIRRELEKAQLFLPAEYTGSLGGWAATNAVSRFSGWYGTARELLLGAKVCTGMGELVDSGAKTTKFSSGYKLWKTLVGSLGWLGVYLEMSFRVYPRPEAFLSGTGELSLLDRLLRGGFRPLCLWATLERGGRETLGAVFGGYASALGHLNLPMSFSEGVLEPPEPVGDTVLIATRRGLEVESAKRAFEVLGAESAIAYIGSGVVRFSTRDFSGVDHARRLFGLPVIVETGDYQGDYWGYRSVTLTRIKQALDPLRVLSPGKFPVSA